MRRYVIDVNGDNDDLHQKAMKKAIDVIQLESETNVMQAVIVADEPVGSIKTILNCVERVV
jgi:hypothetical protein